MPEDNPSLTAATSLPDAALTRRPTLEMLRTIEEPRSLIAGNSVRLLCNGAEVFPAWLAAIDSASDRISLEMYIFAADRIGSRFGEALMRAARRGVRVRLLYDFIGCRSTPSEFFAELRRAGVRTLVYHPHRFWRPRFWTLFRRNHRKTLVCDGRVAFTGGINIADEWLPVSQGGDGWHDAAVEVAGPAVAAIEALFLRTWNRRSRRSSRFNAKALPAAPSCGDVALAVVANTERRDRFAIRRAALHAIRESRERVYLVNPYFVPDPGILRALCRAAERSVSVQLLVPARSDSRTLDLAARATFRQLLRAGVRIFQHAAVVHTKVLLVDRDFVSLGSYNLDHRSLAYNLEMVINTLSPAYNQAVAEMIGSDIAESDEITPDAFERRGLWQRVLERLAYSLRHWL